MKRLLSLLLAISLIFVFAACGTKDTTAQSEADANATNSFIKPENYASVLLVTINPQFRLYLNASGEVLAVEPVNDDAKSIANEVKTVKGNLESVIENIVTATNKGGFVKDTNAATVNFQITEIKDEAVNTDIILNKAKKSADTSFDKLDITVEVKVEVNITAPENSSTNEGENNSSTVTSSSTQSANNASSITSSTAPNESKPAHTHSFAAANCTTPKKCSCGVTQGKALGHSYKDGKCTRCGAKDANSTYTSLNKKGGSWSVEYVVNGTYYHAVLDMVGKSIGVGSGDPLSSMEQEAQDDIRKHKDEPDYKDSYIIFEGKEYWSARGCGTDIKPIVESGNTVTVTSAEESTVKIVFTRTAENTLTVKSVSSDFKAMLEDIPVGTKLTFKAN